MIASRQIAFGKGGKRKPYDAEIEYLGSSGKSCYIDFLQQGLTNNLFKKTSADSLEISLTANMLAQYGWQKLVLIQSKEGVDLQLAVYPEVLTRLGNVRSEVGTSRKSNYTVYYGRTGEISYLSINGEKRLEKTTVYTTSILSSFTLFARGLNSEQVSLNNIVYGLKVTKNDDVILDLIPVRVGNVGYMYDKVSGQLFCNSGTGEFVLGPDIIDYTAKDYVQDGLIAMWDGIENAGWGVHDDTATVWKDLVGGLDIQLGGYWAFDSDGIILSTPTQVGARESGAIHTESMPIDYDKNNLTYEVVFDGRDSVDKDSRMHLLNLYESSYSSDGVYFINDTLTWSRWSNTTLDVSPMGIVKKDKFSFTTTLNEGVVNYYKNGILSMSHNGKTPSNHQRIYVGYSNSLKFAGEKNKWGNIRFYNRDLTADEIAYNYNIDKARFGL